MAARETCSGPRWRERSQQGGPLERPRSLTGRPAGVNWLCQIEWRWPASVRALPQGACQAGQRHRPLSRSCRRRARHRPV